MLRTGGQTSKLSRDLANIRQQLKSGKTRGANSRDLDPEENAALERKRDALMAQMNLQAKERVVNRINAHTTTAVDAAADRIIENQQPTNQRVEAIAAIIVDGKVPPRAEEQSAQERLAQIRQIKSGLTTEAEQLREEKKEDLVRAAEEREERMNTVRSSRTERIKSKKKPAAKSSVANDADTSTSKCNATLVSGKRKGQECGAELPCKRHKQQAFPTVPSAASRDTTTPTSPHSTSATAASEDGMPSEVAPSSPLAESKSELESESKSGE